MILLMRTGSISKTFQMIVAFGVQGDEWLSTVGDTVEVSKW